ncbi:hypothetical protein Tco_0454146 [Tanacetum coccineum]
MVCLSRLGLLPFIAVSKLWDEFVASVERFTINPSPPLAFLTISPLKGVLGLCDLPGKGFVGVLGRWEWVGVSCGVYWRGGLGLKQWGEVGLIFGGYGMYSNMVTDLRVLQVTTDEKGVETEVPPKTAQALLQRKRERKAKSILHLAIPDEYQLRFHGIKDAKSLWARIKTRFEGLDKAYDRFQKLSSLLEVHGAAVPNEDAN